jgi:senataxin
MRDVAKSLLEDVFLRDLKELDSLRYRLSEARSLSRKKVPFVDKLKEPVVYTPLWNEAVRKVGVSDRSSVGFITRIMSRSAHIDILVREALELDCEPEYKDAVSKLRIFLKSTLLEIRTGFDELMARFALVCEPHQLDEQMMANVITLLFSPVAKLHNSALEMFGDCDGRKASIRLALTCQPEAALRGVMVFVEAFNDTAGKLVEACSAAKSLVRCFVDVIETLCGPEQSTEGDTKAEEDGLDEEGGATVGLLSDPSFDSKVRPMLPTLWTNMCRALALILSKCPYWAEFFPAREMVEWMRDALIFGRLMRTHVSSFQSHPDTKENGIETMRGVQDELVAWFRLTDPELIYQAYELMMSFLEGGLAPSPVYRAKLERRLANKDTDLPLPKLEAMKVALDRFALTVPDPNDVQVIEEKPTIKAEKRRRSTEPEGSKPQTRPTKATRHDDDAVITISDDERPVPSSSRTVPAKQTSINKYMQGGATSKPGADKSVKPATSKIFVSTIKPSAAKTSSKSKGFSSGSSALAKIRAEVAARNQQAAVQRADVRMRNAAKNTAVTALASSSPPSSRRSSRPPSSASSRHDMDSDSSSSSDEDIKKTTLAAIAPTIAAKKPEQPKRTMKMLDGPPVMTAQQKRLQEMKRQHDEMQRRTARLKPNLEGLHEQILRWSIDHDGPQPLSIGGTIPKLTRVVPKFHSKQQYFDIFHPLLVNECWSQILQAKEEGPKDSIMCTIMSRSYVDNFTDIVFNIVETMPERWYLAETDIVLLRSMEGDRSILAKITSFKRGSVANQIATGSMRLSTPVEQRVKVQIQERWRMSKIYRSAYIAWLVKVLIHLFSLSTINREYAALTTAEYYDLVDEVLTATSARVSPPPEQRVREAMQAHRLNEPQAKAILASLSTPGFSLIQGWVTPG